MSYNVDPMRSLGLNIDLDIDMKEIEDLLDIKMVTANAANLNRRNKLPSERRKRITPTGH